MNIIHRLVAAVAVVLLLVGGASAASRSNVTIMTYDPGHGTQIEYFDAKGNNFLWYPGNRAVVAGRWKVEGKNICFNYGGNTYNPVTKQRGGNWECMPLALSDNGVVERAKGDIFKLSSGRVPFALKPERTTFAALKGGKSPAPGGKASPKETISPLTGKPVQETCRQIIADAGKSKGHAQMAALLYYHGIHMGERCTNIKVDYVKALTLLRDLDPRSYASLVKDLRSKAESGNPRAANALAKLGL
ncbi:MAG TPA: hypothetical protein PK286_10805 [Devosia sp.]|nr:hypothetical protein [Devosia sp.]